MAAGFPVEFHEEKRVFAMEASQDPAEVKLARIRARPDTAGEF